jgi:hypothetical protein
LILVASSRSTRTNVVDYLAVRINGDSGTNYPWVGMWGSGVAAFSSTNTSNVYLPAADTPGASASAGQFGIGHYQFMDYSATDKHKPVLLRTSYATISDAATSAFAARWASTSAITSLVVSFPYNSAQIAAGSTFNLYGIQS